MAKRLYARKIYKQSRKGLLFLLKAAGFVLFLCGLTGLVLFVSFIKDLPRPEKFAEGDIPQSTKLFDRTGKVLLYEIAGEEKRTLVPLQEVPQHLIDAIIITEDADFYSHRGIDLEAIARAILVDLKLGKPVQGASTISQQLIRSYLLSRKKTIKRKTQEIILTLALEKKYSKQQILEWYLNLIPFGSNLYGVEAASQAFFRKHISDISLAEAAILAALIRAPTFLSPYGENLTNLLQIKDTILERMAKARLLLEETKEEAQKEKITFSTIANPIRAPHFVMFVKYWLEKKYGQDFLTKKGLSVFTTLDWDLQESAQSIVKETVERLEKSRAYNGALVALNPKNGEILVMVGSKDYFAKSFPQDCLPGKDCLFDPQVNAAIALRQPGSAFKPFVYALAFKKGYTPNTVLWDIKTEFNPNCAPTATEDKDRYGSDCYHPQNYDGRFRGPLTLKSSLAQSINLTSVKLLYLVGINDVLDFVEKLGITSLKDRKNYGLSLVLGGGEVKLAEMVSAFSVFSQDGVWVPSSFILKIEDAKGDIIEQGKKTPLRVLETRAAQQINSVLSNNELRAPMFGSNSSLYFGEANPVAAKTGTTQNYKDAWAIGYTPSLVVGVWVGNNNNEPMVKKAGISFTGPIFQQFMWQAFKKFPPEDFKKASDILTGKPVLDGEMSTPLHSILHYVNKKDPQGPVPQNPSIDPQYFNWEQAVTNY